MCNGNQGGGGGALLTAMTFAQGLNEKLLNARDLTSITRLPLVARLLPREFEAEREMRALDDWNTGVWRSGVYNDRFVTIAIGSNPSQRRGGERVAILIQTPAEHRVQRENARRRGHNFQP